MHFSLNLHNKWVLPAILASTIGVVTAYVFSLISRNLSDIKDDADKLTTDTDAEIEGLAGPELELEHSGPNAIEDLQLEKRKPSEKWNTVLFFPPTPPRPGMKSGDDTLDLDLTQSPPESEFESLSFYFDKAGESIQICALLISEFELANIIRRKRNSGLIIQVITDHDTLAERNGSLNSSSRYLRKIGKTHSNLKTQIELEILLRHKEIMD